MTINQVPVKKNIAARHPKRYLRSAVAGLLMSALTLVAVAAGAQPAGAANAAESRPQARTIGPPLDPAGWRPEVYSALVQTIEANAFTGKVATFDFDNTTQGRDISESVLGAVDVTGLPNLSKIPKGVLPVLGKGKKSVKIADGAVKYYEKLAGLGTPGSGYVDTYGAYASLMMAAQVFAGQPLTSVYKATKKAYKGGAGLKDLTTGKESMIGGMPRAFVYPQMADLYGYLRSRGYDVWVVSAGVVWSVRYMVKFGLNPVIAAKYGSAAQLPLDHVLAISTLLRDKRTGKLWTDKGIRKSAKTRAVLNLKPKALKRFEVTGMPSYPNSWAGGKVAAILEGIGRQKPFLAGGDALGDFEMLNAAENRLWIARLDKTPLQSLITEQIAIDQPGKWLLQPTISGAPVGFAATSCELSARKGMTPTMQKTVNNSIALLNTTGQLGNFSNC